MAQVRTDENQDDVLEPTDQRGVTPEKVVAPGGPEVEIEKAVGRKLITIATLREIAEQVKEFGKDMISNPHAKETIKLQTYNLALAALAAAEVVPGVEVVNDVTKALAIAQKAVEFGKKEGFFKELYRDIPPGLMKFVEATDLINVPIAPIIPEIVQSTVNQFKLSKEQFLFGKDVVKNAFTRIQSLSQPSPEVAQAKLQFAPAMA